MSLLSAFDREVAQDLFYGAPYRPHGIISVQPTGALLRTERGWEGAGPGWTIIEQLPLDEAADENTIIRTLAWLHAIDCCVQTPTREAMLAAVDEFAPPPLPAEVRSWLRCA